LHISAKLQGGICKTSCWLTEDFDGRGKLINVVQFQGVIEVLLISGGNWRNLQFHGGNCLFTLIKITKLIWVSNNNKKEVIKNENFKSC